jgi:antitoxin component YwqK of YwqJK toxin-antitoxin module
MRPAKIAAFLAIVVSSSKSFASNNPPIARLSETRSQMVRPAIARLPSLSERRGLTSAENDLFNRKYSPQAAKEIETTAIKFWSLDLLKALAAASNLSFDEGSDDAEEWLKRFDVTSPLGVSRSSSSSFGLQDQIQLTFLSSSGFVRLENSQELVSASGRDMFAGVPAADFCERKPGVSVPVDYSLKFSPWEVATRLASSSRLEISLLNLILNPDALAIDLDFSERQKNKKNLHYEHAHGWADVLDRMDASIKNRTLKLSDLANLTRRDTGVEQTARSLILAAAVSAPSLRKSCESIGGIWSEVRWGDNDWLELVACRAPDRTQRGFVLAVDDGDLVEGTVVFSTIVHSLRIEAKLDAETEKFSVRFLDPSKSIDSEIWFTEDGKVREVKDGNGPEQRRVMFDSNGQVQMINHLSAVKNLRNLSWYSSGHPKSFQATDEKGEILAHGGFYENGTPKFWQPYLSGRKDGKLIWWFSNGTTAGEVEFAAGRRFGFGSVYYENGVEGYHGEYADDQLHGKMVWRDPAGRSLFTLGYTGGKAHGLLEIRHGGRTMAEARFHGGAVEGTVLVRNQKGLVVGEVPYQAGLLDGGVILRDSNGSVRVSSAWNDGQLDGETEIWYASKAKASYCKFDEGHLIEWASFRPDATYRYAGKVSSIKEGLAVIEYFGGGVAPNLRCKTNDWSIDDCESITGVKTHPAPKLRDFAKSLASNEAFVFKPEKCGGFSQSFDVSPFADLLNGSAEIIFRVKGACNEVGLATSIRCRAGLKGGAWYVDGCDSISAVDHEY